MFFQRALLWRFCAVDRCFSINGVSRTFSVIALTLALLLPSPSFGQGARDIHLPAGGINLGPYNYFDRGQPFVDYAKMGGSWFSTDGIVWTDDRPLEFGPTGYPVSLDENQIARSLIFTHNGEFYQTGKYRVTWEGTGDVALRGGNNSIDLVSSVPGAATFDVTATNRLGLLLEIRETDVEDPVRNIRVFEEALQDYQSVFHPSYTSDLDGYGVLRFMDWNQTNRGYVERWSHRTRLHDAFWGGDNGVPYERQIELSNELKQDIWINIPHAAGNHFVRQLARMIEEQLDPDLRVWLEYTNEYWNPLFPQNEYVQTELTERYGVTGQTPAYAMRSAEIFDVFAEEFDSDRTLRVFGAWGSVVFPMWAGLPAMTDESGRTNADVTAIAAYFSLTDDQMVELYNDYKSGEDIDMDQVFADLRADIDHNSVFWLENRKISTQYGLPMVAYEAGQHIRPTTPEQEADEGFLELLYAINRDERMGDAYDYLAETWREIGGSTLTLFNNMSTWDRTGMWGLREGFHDPDVPKRQAVLDFLEAGSAGYDGELLSWVGDFNTDGVVDVDDLDFLTLSIQNGGTSGLVDLNKDGRLTAEDRLYFIEEVLGTKIGDSDLDGLVTTSDIVLAFESGTYEDTVTGNGSWRAGDWDGNLEFDSGDFVYLLEQGAFQGAAAGSVVPEPTPACWLLLLPTLLLRRRR